MFVYQGEHRVDRRLGVAAAGVRFDRGVENLEILAQPGPDLLRVGLDAVGFEKPVPPFDHRPRSDEPVSCEERGVNAAERGPARVEPLGPRAVGQKLHAPRGLTARDAQRGRAPHRIQPQQLGRGDRRAERSARRRGMKPASIVIRRPYRHRQPCRGLETCHARGQERRAARPEVFGHGQRRGKDGNPEMDRTALMGIVQFQAVRRCAVG